MYWDGMFPPAADQQKEIATMLQTLNQLREESDNTEEQLRLAEWYQRFVALRQNYDAKAHREAWAAVAKDYGRYGYPLGARPRKRKATPGHYAIEIRYRGETIAGQVSFREDPLLDKTKQ